MSLSRESWPFISGSQVAFVGARSRCESELTEVPKVTLTHSPLRHRVSRSLVAGGNQHRHSCVAAWKLNEVPVSAAVRCRATQHVSGARVINCHPLSAYSSHCRAGNRGQFPARPAEQRRALELRIANLMSVLICICSHSPAS